MKQTLFQEKYPVYTLEVPKAESRFADVDAILAHLRDCVEGHKVARMIGEFDHFAHTSDLPEGEIAGDIKAAKEMLIYWASCPKIRRSRKTRFPGSFIFSDLRRRQWRGVLPRMGSANKSALP